MEKLIKVDEKQIALIQDALQMYLKYGAQEQKEEFNRKLARELILNLIATPLESVIKEKGNENIL